jgi:RimJ/RimL family protein N-acetyltransferase
VPIEPPDPPLTDGVVRLRLPRLADAEAIAAASHDPVTLQWMSDPARDAETVRASVPKVPAAWRAGRTAPMVIADAPTDRVAGLINVQFKAEDFTTVAYSVFPSERGRGFAPRAVRLVADWALGGLGLEHLHLEVEAENAASIRVAEKSGFARIGTREHDRPGIGRVTVVTFRRSAVIAGKPGRA